MPSRKQVADIALVVSIAISIGISAITVSKLFANQSAMLASVSSPSYGAPNLQDKMPSSAQDEASSERQLPPEPSIHDYASSGDSLGAAVPNETPQSPSAVPGGTTTTFYTPVYESSQYILPLTWGAVAGTLIWRGKVRSQWCKQGYDYDMFRLLARMKGSPIRVALLTSVSSAARTRAELAADLDVDWKTIDNHIDVLSKNGLVQEIGAFGTSRYFAVTERGRKVLSLLMSLDNDTGSENTNASYAEKSEMHAADSRQPVTGSLN